MTRRPSTRFDRIVNAALPVVYAACTPLMLFAIVIVVTVGAAFLMVTP